MCGVQDVLEACLQGLAQTPNSTVCSNKHDVLDNIPNPKGNQEFFRDVDLSQTHSPKSGDFQQKFWAQGCGTFNFIVP